jgi:hypothetical protein
MSAQFIRECRKALVAVVGFASTLIALGVLDGDTASVVLAAIAGLTAAGVYRVPNAPKA